MSTETVHYKPRKVLLVDDESYVLSVLTRKFTELGDDVRTAGDGGEGLIVAADWLPDLIVSDVQMPVIGGLELALRLRSAPVTANIPLILLTARPDCVSRAELAQTNVRVVVDKPFSPRVLLAHADKLVPRALAA